MRSARLAALLIGAVVSSVIQAQSVGAVRGKVIDQNGRGVENAEVELLPGSRRAITLDDGGFGIADIPHGVYVLSARRIGYEPTDVNVVVGDSETTITITLVAISAQLEAIHIREKAVGIQYSAVVLDQFDAPVADAEVVAIGINSHLVTDDRGRFIVPKLGKGTLALRIRKIGYSAYLGSYRILAERADTIRMARLAASLTPLEINELSGFGRDYWAYRELDQRIRWKSPLGGAISREELAQQGSANLCDALPHTASGNRYFFISPADCHDKFYRVLVDGAQCEWAKLTDFTADRVELVESYPKVTDPKCPRTPAKPREFFVIWTRHDAANPTPIRTIADAANPAADTTDQGMRLAPVEVRAAVPLLNAAHLAGQVVDSANHPIRSALVYTQDPLFATLSDKKGYFNFRELPSGPITIRAERGGYVPVEFQLRLPPDSTVGIGLKLLRAVAPIGTMMIDSSGTQGRIVRVLSERGQPIMYANVTLNGATVRITDEKGELNLGLGARQKFSVRVARIGFAPWFGVVNLPAGATMTVTLPQIAQLLAPVTVAGGADGPRANASLPLKGFYDRWMMRQKGTLTGVFIGPEEMEFRHPVKVSRMLAGLELFSKSVELSGRR